MGPDPKLVVRLDEGLISPEVPVQAISTNIQTGISLWRIAEAYWGDGRRYMDILSLNSGTISDPDLIYPGQVLELPDVVENLYFEFGK